MNYAYLRSLPGNVPPRGRGDRRPEVGTLLADETVLTKPSALAAAAGLTAGTAFDYQATTEIGWTDQQSRKLTWDQWTSWVGSGPTHAVHIGLTGQPEPGVTGSSVIGRSKCPSRTRRP